MSIHWEQCLDKGDLFFSFPLLLFHTKDYSYSQTDSKMTLSVIQTKYGEFNQMLHVWTKLKQRKKTNKKLKRLEFHKSEINLLICVLAFKHALCIQILSCKIRWNKITAPMQIRLGTESPLEPCLCSFVEKVQKYLKEFSIFFKLSHVVDDCTDLSSATEFSYTEVKNNLILDTENTISLALKLPQRQVFRFCACFLCQDIFLSVGSGK